MTLSGTLPKGVVKHFEGMLTEIDPYTDKIVKETSEDVTKMLTEER